MKGLKEVAGFIANKLQHALWKEVVSIVESGIADAATVDETLRSAFAIMLLILGPMGNYDQP